MFRLYGLLEHMIIAWYQSLGHLLWVYNYTEKPGDYSKLTATLFLNINKP